MHRNATRFALATAVCFLGGILAFRPDLLTIHSSLENTPSVSILPSKTSLPSVALELPSAPLTKPMATRHADPVQKDFPTPGLPADEQASLWKAFSEARRAVEPISGAHAQLPCNAGARLFAQNPGQMLTARFLDQGVKVQFGQQGSEWQAVFSTSSLPQATEIAHAGTRVEYVRGPVIEWFDNRPDGIQQGFIVTKPLDNTDDVRLEIDVQGLSAQALNPSALQLSDSAGTPRLAYSNLLAWDATGKTLPAHMEATDGGIHLIVAAAGAQYPLTIDPLISSLEQKLGPEVTEPGSVKDNFGYSVALSGDTALIGAFSDDTSAGSNVGSAYVFVRSGSSWSQQAKLTAADAAAGDNFGNSVALSGDTALVGAYQDDTAAGSNAGSAYVFVRSGSSWSQQAKLTAADAAFSDFFGWSVDLSGDTALIGATYDDTAAGSEVGSAYVFVRSGSFWTQQAKLTAGDAAFNDQFGNSVALSGDTALIGAYQDDNAAVVNAGSAYVFIRSGSTWSQQAKLSASDAAYNDYFGYSVALSGDTALVGAYQDDTSAGTDAGSAYVFVRTGSSWSQQAKLTAADAEAGDFFGWSVDLSGDTALFGAYQDNTAGGSDAGSAYVFFRSGSFWSQQAKLSATDAPFGDRFGMSVDLSGDTALVGAANDDTAAGINAGSAYVFVRSGSSWSQQAKLAAVDAAAGDSFGSSVALSGETALVGASRDATAAGTYAGSAYVFVRSGSSWSQQAKLTASDAAAIDIFGISVALSGDTALIGAAYDDTASGVDTGSAYVFVRSGISWSQQAKLTAADAAPSDIFGNSVALSGDTALVGAYWDDTAAGIDAGSAYVFVRSGSSWSQQAKLTAADAAENYNFGWSVALSGDTALIGAVQHETASGLRDGSAYVFVRTGSSWSQQTKLAAADAAADDFFGNSVALSGDTALVGAYQDDTSAGTDTGSAYVFVRSGSSWSQQAKLAAVDAAAGDFFGNSVALSGDTALVGASYDDGYDLGGDPAADQGSVYIYRLMESDSDGDGVSDVWETSNGFNVDVANDHCTLDTYFDGDVDLLELFQGTDRAVAGERHGLTTTSAMIDTTTRQLKTRYRRSATQTAVLGGFEWSSDLTTWKAPDVDHNGVQVTTSESVITSGSGYEIREVTATVAIGTPDRLFLRLALQPAE